MDLHMSSHCAIFHRRRNLMSTKSGMAALKLWNPGYKRSADAIGPKLLCDERLKTFLLQPNMARGVPQMQGRRSVVGRNDAEQASRTAGQGN